MIPESDSARAAGRPDAGSHRLLLALWLITWAMAGAAGAVAGGGSTFVAVALAVVLAAVGIEWLEARPGRAGDYIAARFLLGAGSGFAAGLAASGAAGTALLVWPIVWLAWRERTGSGTRWPADLWVAVAYLPVQAARFHFLGLAPADIAVETVVLVALVAGQAGLGRMKPLPRPEAERTSTTRLIELVRRYMPANAFEQDQIMDLLEKEKARTDRYGGNFSVCLFDIDDFESICERHGAATGDHVLHDFAERILGRMRQMDVAGLWQPGDEPVGPWGGKEFLVVLPQTPMRGGISFAGRIRQAVALEPLGTPDGTMPTSVSAGVAQYEIGERIQDLLARADDALASARRGGGGRIVAAGR